jgi:hypothetical protein
MDNSKDLLKCREGIFCACFIALLLLRVWLLVYEVSTNSLAVSGIFARKQYVGVPNLVFIRRTHSELTKLVKGDQHDPFAVLSNSSINTCDSPIWILFRHTRMDAVERQRSCVSGCGQRYWDA